MMNQNSIKINAEPQISQIWAEQTFVYNLSSIDFHWKLLNGIHILFITKG